MFNTNIYLYAGMPLDGNYEHTIWFDSAQKQKAFFINELYPEGRKVKYLQWKFTNGAQYLKEQEKTARIPRRKNDIEKCNYMVFQNGSGKMMCAFIDSIDYINENASLVHYSIDKMQTYMFDYDMGECYVEREHSLTDKIGEHIIDEGLDTGELVTSKNWEAMLGNTNNGYIICSTIDIEEVWNYDNDHVPHPLNKYQKCLPYTVDNLAQGYGMFWVKTADNYNTIMHRLNNSGQIDSVIMAFTFPGSFLSDLGYTADVLQLGKREQANRSVTLTKTITINPLPTTYTARNNKMYCYPYTRLIVRDNSGNTKEYRPEMFAAYATNKSVSFLFRTAISQKCSIIAVPLSYRGQSQGYPDAVKSGDNYPISSWASDTFLNWLNQNALSLGVQAIGNVARIGIGVGAGSPYALAGGITGIMGMLATTTEKAFVANEARGGVATGEINFAHNLTDFYCAYVIPTPEYFKSIDDFFTMFGYATRKIKVPNVRDKSVIAQHKLRPHWNYIKTKACVLHATLTESSDEEETYDVSGSMPTDIEKDICKIYDNGITFWMNPEEVGDYSLDNSPVGG